MTPQDTIKAAFGMFGDGPSQTAASAVSRWCYEKMLKSQTVAVVKQWSSAAEKYARYKTLSKSAQNMSQRGFATPRSTIQAQPFLEHLEPIGKGLQEPIGIRTFSIRGELFFTDSPEKTIEHAREAKKVELDIQCIGGDLDWAFRFAELLRGLGVPIHAEVRNAAWSAAAVLLLAADTRRIHTSATMMFHPTSCGYVGTAAQLRAVADSLDATDGKLVAFVSERTGQPESIVRKWMEEEKYFTASECLKYGFATQIFD